MFLRIKIFSMKKVNGIEISTLHEKVITRIVGIFSQKSFRTQTSIFSCESNSSNKLKTTINYHNWLHFFVVIIIFRTL